jgi:hypothetical protein
MTRESYSGFNLFVQEIGIYVGIGILCRMIVWITIFVGPLVILDLYCSDYSLLTEGTLIPSGTTGDNLWRQMKLVSSDYLAQHLNKTRRLVSRPELHRTIVI